VPTDLLAFAHALCDDAGTIALAHFRRDLDVRTKPDRTLVTRADTAIETRLRERIAAAFPQHGVCGEEYGTEGDASARWIIDPIDATNNFVRGVPVFATLVAFERDGEVELGVVAAHAMGERWHAARGRGAWAGPRRLHVSGIGDVSEAHVLYGSATGPADGGRGAGFAALLRAAWRNRGFGDYWGYALVAEGAAEMMVDPDISPWDVAAPSILVEEAGGRFTDLDGARTIYSRHALASNGVLHDRLLQYFHAAAAADRPA